MIYTHIRPGVVVNSPPWQAGKEGGVQRAIVVSETWGTTGEYALVWFPELGSPAVGLTVMPILKWKMWTPRDLDDEPAVWVRKCQMAISTSTESKPEWEAAWNVVARNVISRGR